MANVMKQISETRDNKLMGQTLCEARTEIQTDLNRNDKRQLVQYERIVEQNVDRTALKHRRRLKWWNKFDGLKNKTEMCSIVCMYGCAPQRVYICHLSIYCIIRISFVLLFHAVCSRLCLPKANEFCQLLFSLISTKKYECFSSLFEGKSHFYFHPLAQFAFVLDSFFFSIFFLLFGSLPFSASAKSKMASAQNGKWQKKKCLEK